VVFLTTANTLDGIPEPLLDRMEIVQLAGYTQNEKIQIARRFLVKRQLDATGLTAEQAEISDDALALIAHAYTYEAGVRNLERQIGQVMRHAALRIAEGSATHVRIEAADVEAILGAPRFENEIAMRTSVPGVATGLAWTRAGGDILFIETTRSPGGGRLILTGQLGDVMKESAQAALSLVKNRAAAIGIDQALFEKTDIHIHIPAGAIPKDGPSAGVALFSSLVSLLTGRNVRSDTAMTGEISLRGLVLPVGGIKEKTAAAVRAGITRVVLPARNKKDLEDISEDVRSKLEFIWASEVGEVLSAVLEEEVVA
jgi:ATP-dependent Lon protease